MNCSFKVKMILLRIGALTVAYYSVRVLLMVWQAFMLWSMCYFKWDTQLKKRFGEWAVVTGSTDGIGKQYALQLAQRGLNVVLISRNPHKLQTVAEEIESKYGVKTKTIVADFSEGAKVYAHIEEELGDVPVGILMDFLLLLPEWVRIKIVHSIMKGLQEEYFRNNVKPPISDRL